tara:strand:+ start:593 stop:1210 length:618 start_codon:yes stop_codon:yes gene_type:complete
LVDFNFDKNFKDPIVGVDEVGRGSWAGPVMAGACLLNYKKSLPKNLNDSKKLTPKIRYEIFEKLKDNAYYGIGVSSNNEIDNYGLQRATFRAMERAFVNLRKKFCKLKIATILIDGNQNPGFQDKFGVDTKLIVKGDTISPSIAAASIFAKCTRDLHMLEMDTIYKGYGFRTNMGYGTRLHKNKLLVSGSTQLHRMTFSPMKNMK